MIPYHQFTAAGIERPFPLAAATYIVDPEGNGDHTSIQDAVDAANPGDTILVWNGTYYNSINVYKSLVIIGNGTSASIMDGQGTLDHQHLFHLNKHAPETEPQERGLCARVRLTACALQQDHHDKAKYQT